MDRIGRRRSFPAVVALVGLAVISCSTSCTDKSPKDAPVSVAVSPEPASDALGADPTIAPGKWEARRTVTRADGGSQTEEITWCMTPEQAADLPKAMTGGGECATLNESKSGRKLTWSMECQMPGQGARSYSKGELVAEGGNATLAMETTTVINAQTTTWKTSWEGKRIGPCD